VGKLPVFLCVGFRDTNDVALLVTPKTQHKEAHHYQNAPNKKKINFLEVPFNKLLSSHSFCCPASEPNITVLWIEPLVIFCHVAA
jgi:hypothetical protein